MQVEVPEYELHDEVTVDPDHTALIVVDMQNDFVRPDGKLPVAGAEDSIPAIRHLIDLCHEHEIPVLYTQDSHHAGDPEFAIWGEHVLVGTDGWKIVEELAPDANAGDRVFRKDRYDGFFGTELEETLEQEGTKAVIVCGTVANICVLHTAASAALRWYEVILPVDATSALNEFDMATAIRQVDFLFAGKITRSPAIHVRG